MTATLTAPQEQPAKQSVGPETPAGVKKVEGVDVKDDYQKNERDRKRSIADARVISKEIDALNSRIDKYNQEYEKSQGKPGGQIKVKNYLAELKDDASQLEVHVAAARTDAETLVKYYESLGITREQMKDMKVRLSNGEIKRVALIRPDGSVESDPEKLIGKAIKDNSGNIVRYDYNGDKDRLNPRDKNSPAYLDTNDGILTLLTGQNWGVKDTVNSCTKQCYDEIKKAISLVVLPEMPAAPEIPNVTVPVRPGLTSTPTALKARTPAPREGTFDECIDTRPVQMIKPPSRAGSLFIPLLGGSSSGGGGCISVPCLPGLAR